MAYINGNEILFSANVTQKKATLYAPSVSISETYFKIVNASANGSFANKCSYMYRPNGSITWKTMNSPNPSANILISSMPLPCNIRHIVVSGTNFNDGVSPLELYFDNTGSKIAANQHQGSLIFSHTIASNNLSIGDEAFKSCVLLGSIIFYYGCKTIGARVFSGCSSLKEIKIPSSVTSISSDAFSGSSLKDIYVPWSASSSLNANAPWGASGATIYYS